MCWPSLQINIDNSHSCFKAAYDAGINFLDCVEGYAGGESERVIGRAIKRSGWETYDIVVSTKVRTLLIKST